LYRTVKENEIPKYTSIISGPFPGAIAQNDLSYENTETHVKDFLECLQFPEIARQALTKEE
jgi:hypothetical protein